MHLIKEVRDISRFRHILTVLFEEGFGIFLERIKLKKHVPLNRRFRTKAKQKVGIEAQVRGTLERLGPTFIKFGQMLSVRPDLLPKSYIKELEKLQDRVPPIPYSKVQQIVEGELKKPIGRIFLEFEKKPIASASISQVHKAKLKSGDIVAVKIQRPDVKKMMETDIEILFYIAGMLEKHYLRVREFNPVCIVEEFRDWTEKELDFRIEARNASRFAVNFKKNRDVKIPKVFDDFVTEKILVTEFIEGIELHNYKGVIKAGLDFGKILRKGFELSLEQVFVYGLFHADPHPGNILIMKDGRIALVDFGIVGFFDEKLKNKSIDLLYGLIENDVDLIVETLLGMGMETEKMDVDKFRADIAYLIEPLQNSSLKDIKLSYVLEDILELALRHKLKVPTSFVLLGKTIVTLEGVGLEYDPNFKIVDATKPFLEKMMQKRLNPMNMFRGFLHNAHRYSRLAEEFPARADRALRVLEKGSVKLDMRDTDIKKLAIEIDRSSNRIAYGLIIAALLLSSALILQVNKGPKILDLPVFSLLSFMAAGFFGLILFWSIIREKYWLV